MLNLTRSERTPGPFDRGHFAPGHFTASAFILSPEGDALLLIHHAKLGRWLQPGGHVEASDSTLLDAARREADEEVGLGALRLHPAADGPFDLDVHAIPPLGEEPGHEHFDVRFLFQAEDLAYRTTDEVRAARWTPLPEIANDPAADRSVLRAVDKVLALVSGNRP